MSENLKKVDYVTGQDGRQRAVTREQTEVELAKSLAGPKEESMQSINEIFSIDDALQKLHAPAPQHETQVRVEAQTLAQSAQTQGRSMRR